MLEDISKKPESNRIIVATHNEESVRRAAKRYDHMKSKSHFNMRIYTKTVQW